MFDKECTQFTWQPFPTAQAGKADFEYLEKKAIEWGEPKVPSGKQVLKILHFKFICFFFPAIDGLYCHILHILLLYFLDFPSFLSN